MQKVGYVAYIHMHMYIYIYTHTHNNVFKRYLGILVHNHHLCQLQKVLNNTTVVVGVSVHWTYSSSSSSATSATELRSSMHSRSSILSLVGMARFLVNHGGLWSWQHVPPPSQT